MSETIPLKLILITPPFLAFQSFSRSRHHIMKSPYLTLDTSGEALGGLPSGSSEKESPLVINFIRSPFFSVEKLRVSLLRLGIWSEVTRGLSIDRTFNVSMTDYSSRNPILDKYNHSTAYTTNKYKYIQI